MLFIINSKVVLKLQKSLKLQFRNHCNELFVFASLQNKLMVICNKIHCCTNEATVILLYKNPMTLAALNIKNILNY